MYPVLFKIGPISVYGYGFWIAVGIIAAFWVGAKEAERVGLPKNKVLDIAFWTIVFAFIFSKVGLLFEDPSFYLSNMKELLRSGGVFYAGLAGGLIFLILLLKIKKLPFWKTMDVYALVVPLAHGFGRQGCFSAGCCYGRPTDVPWGVVFHSQFAHEHVGTPLGVKIHPVQLYESFLNFTLFLILFFVVRKRKKFDGLISALYLIGYGIIRFHDEYYRGDPGRGWIIHGSSPWTSLSVPQFISILLILSGIAIILFRRRHEKLKGRTAG